jgi:hypothetical protein
MANISHLLVLRMLFSLYIQRLLACSLPVAQDRTLYRT